MSITVGQAFERYLKEITPNKTNAMSTEMSVVKAWLKLGFSERLLNQITVQHIVQARDGWLETLKPATVTRRLAFLSHVYSVGSREWGLETGTNPVNQIRKPVVNNNRTRRLFSDIGLPGFPKSELEWLCRCTKSRELPVLIKLAVETAMRRSELLSLEWQHVDLANKYVYLPKTKNGEVRYVPLSPYALTLLKRRKTKSSSDGHVFSMKPGSMTRSFIRVVEKARRKYEQACRDIGAGIDPRFFLDLRFHDLRHEAVSRMAPHFQVHELARISGHKDTRMLMRYYHPDPTELANRLALIKRR